jgi:dephospho-CoA kinase
MLLVAITGSLCAGKSLILSFFAEQGIPTFDSDQKIREILGENKKIIQSIEKKYPSAVREGKVDREKLGDAVFHSKSKLKELEGLLYPVLFEREDEFIRRNSRSPLLALEVPLLYEKSLASKYDKVIAVEVSEETKRARAESRGIKPERIEAILSNQLPEQLKKTKADYIINTDYNKNMVRKKVELVIKAIKEAYEANNSRH